MAKFNYYDYDETYVMYCDTKAKAEIFIKHLDKVLGRKVYRSKVGGGICWSTNGTGYRFVGENWDSAETYLGDKWQYLGISECNVLDFDSFEWDGYEAKKPDIQLSFDELMGMTQQEAV